MPTRTSRWYEESESIRATAAGHTKELDIQLRRMAQMQAQIDELTARLEELTAETARLSARFAATRSKVERVGQAIKNRRKRRM